MANDHIVLHCPHCKQNYKAKLGNNPLVRDGLTITPLPVPQSHNCPKGYLNSFGLSHDLWLFFESLKTGEGITMRDIQSIIDRWFKEKHSHRFVLEPKFISPDPAIEQKLMCEYCGESAEKPLIQSEAIA